MRKHKASYIYRIGDETFVIYRLSHYSREPLKAVEAGITFNDRGEFSDDFLRKTKKYSIDIEDNRYEFLSDTRKDMCLSLHLQQSAGAESNKLPEEQVPKRVLDRECLISVKRFLTINLERWRIEAREPLHK
jgi:hypothetical protein